VSEVLRSAGDELSAAQLYDLLRLRCEVFVVEQECAYQELDGLDLLSTTTHLWVEAADRRVLSCLRVFPGELRDWRIGRVCTAADQRGQGHSARLMRAALDRYPGSSWMLHAQCAVVEFYRRMGFAESGPEFDEDGIPHVLMVRNV
jgi:ElaA protein